MAALFALESSEIASRLFGMLRLNLGSGWPSSADTSISGFAKQRRAGGTWSGKWSTVDITRMHMRLHALLRLGQISSVVRVGAISAPSSTGVMMRALRAHKSRFLTGPRVPAGFAR